MRGQEDVCARPDCSYPGHAEEEGDFVVERIVGRKPTADDNNNFLWLIKWDGYMSLFTIPLRLTNHISSVQLPDHNGLVVSGRKYGRLRKASAEV
jgi:hypothetical protein